MIRFFAGQKNKKVKKTSSRGDFDYVSDGMLYFDSACQTLRPRPVVDSMNEYFYKYGACGGRVKYQWGKRVDEELESCREKVLSFIGKSPKNYLTAFSLNTTYGINLILSQLPRSKYKKIIISDIEHNSVFLPTISASKRLNIPREIFSRKNDGSLIYEKESLDGAVVVVNAVSNIDGRVLRNIKTLADDVHDAGGILIIDGAQSVAGNSSLLSTSDFDALCFSGHKTYAPSLGVIVAKKELVNSLEPSFCGGGMVESLDKDTFSIPQEDPSCRLEPGLQDYAGIIGLSSALDWLKKYKPEGLKQDEQKQKLAKILFEGIKSLPGVRILNNEPSTTISFYQEDIDSHRFASFLSEQNVMLRSGYFCCHYYLLNLKKYPPLLRVSLGLHNTEADVKRLIEIMEKIITNVSPKRG